MGRIKAFIESCAEQHMAVNPNMTWNEAWEWAAGQSLEGLLNSRENKAILEADRIRISREAAKEADEVRR